MGPPVDPFQDDPNRDLKLRFDQLQKSQREQQRYLNHLNSDNYHLMNQKLDFEKRIKETEEEIATVKQDLSASTVDAPAEGTMSPDMASKELRSLTDNIFLVARDILQRVEPLLPTDQITADAKETISNAFFEVLKDEEVSYLIDRFPFPCSPLTLLIPIVHRSLFRAIMVAAFEPFVPGELNQPTEQLLSQIYAYLGETETQDRRSRWRALTYHHISQERPEKVWTPLSAQYYQQLQAIVQLLLKETFMPEEEQVQNNISTIFEQAINARDKLMTECTEIDCSVVLPAHGRFANWMKSYFPVNRNPPQRCIFSLSWVIQFSLSRGQGQEPKWFNNILAIVIADNSKLLTTIQDLDKLK
ncbi:hypothetical protein FRC18_007576 [Serendipita sp. 400]|nr:hypothetical protein FRC18_007576 [Serendipita sp. 400]